MTETITRRHRPGRWAMLFGLFGAGLMWSIHSGLGEAVVAQTCHRYAMAAHVPGWLMPSIYGMTALAVSVGAAGLATAWRNWRLTRIRPDAKRHALDNDAGRNRFLAMVSLLFSLLFVAGLGAASLAVLLVSPCGSWR